MRLADTENKNVTDLLSQRLLPSRMEMEFALSEHAYQFIDLTENPSGLEDIYNGNYTRLY